MSHAPTVKVVSPELGLSGRDRAYWHDLAVGDHLGDNYPAGDNYWDGTQRDGNDNYGVGDNYSAAGERDSITNNLATTGKNSCRRPAKVVDADHGRSWTEGQAFHRVIWQNWSATGFGIFIRAYEPSWLSPLLTTSVLVIEATLAALIISPFFGRTCRRVAAVLIVFLHCSIDLFNDLGIFVPVLPVLALLLLAVNEWGAFERWVLARADRRAPRIAAFLRATGPTSEESPPARGAFDRAGRKLLLGAREAWNVFLAVAVAWNVWDVNPFPERWLGETTSPAPTRAAIDLLDLPGGWRMFSPDAPDRDMRVVVDAVLPGGRHVDPLTGAPPDFDVLEHGPWGLHNLWMTYEYQLCVRNQRLLWVALMGYLRRIPEVESWDGPRRFESIEIWVASIHRPDYGGPITPRRLALAARWPSGADDAAEDPPEPESIRPPDGMAR